MKDETLLYGVKADEPDYMEVILSSRPEMFEHVKILASKDGYNRFRVAHFKFGERPDFVKAVKH